MLEGIAVAKPITTCSVIECGKRAHGKGLCATHYRRLSVNGDPNVTRKPGNGSTLKFATEVAAYTGDDCVPWPFYRDRHGYGWIGQGNKLQPAHRKICEMSHGPAPTELHQAAHSCGKGHLGCVNPRHLRWATAGENQLDRARHGTDIRGEKHPMQVLTESDVRTIRKLRGHKSQSDIGRLFGVDQTTICNIHRRKTWAWLE